VSCCFKPAKFRGKPPLCSLGNSFSSKDGGSGMEAAQGIQTVLAKSPSAGICRRSELCVPLGNSKLDMFWPGTCSPSVSFLVEMHI
jgi:hypothetical protein